MLSENALKSIYITGESQPKELTDEVLPANLPKIYGGECQCGATCIYSEKGPWSPVQNVVDYQNKVMTTTEAEYVENKQQFHSDEFNKLIMQSNSDSDGDGGIDLLGDMAGQ